MEFEIIEPEKIADYLGNINPIPFSREFQTYCKLRYGANSMFIGAKSEGNLKWILPVATYSLYDLKIAEIPNATYYTEPIIIDNTFRFDLDKASEGLFNFLGVDMVKFNVVDYGDRFIKKEYPVKFVAIDLDVSMYESAEDLLMRGVVLRRRNQIRFSHKQGFETVMLKDNELEKFYELYKKHHRDRNFAVRGIDELRNFITAFGEKTKILTVYSGDKMVAGILFVVEGPCLWMIINASDYEFSYFQVNNYIYWEVIKFGFENGVKYFDFGGTPVNDTGNSHFKKGFGVKLHDIYSPIYFRTNSLRFRYWFGRKKWHLKLRWRVVKNWFKKKLQ